MIYHSMDKEETSKELIGTQKKNLSYTYLHWGGNRKNKHKFYPYEIKLSYHSYQPIGPTLLVEWGDE